MTAECLLNLEEGAGVVEKHANLLPATLTPVIGTSSYSGFSTSALALCLLPAKTTEAVPSPWTCMLAPGIKLAQRWLLQLFKV